MKVSNHEFSAVTEEVKIIWALEFFWPLLRTKNVTHIFAKLLITSDTFKTNLLYGFYPDPGSW